MTPTDIIQLVNVGVTAFLGIVGAIIIAPLRALAAELGDVRERLAYIEGQLRRADNAGDDRPAGFERRHDRR